MEEIIIQKDENILIVCVLENGHICERYQYDQENRERIGNIYIGIVEDIVEGMQAAFINIGAEKNAFIATKDVLPKFNITKETVPTFMNIKDILKKGQSLLVQVKKDPTAEKGARISKHITLPGNYVVLMPGTDILTLSQKIEDEKERERLKKIVEETLPPNFGAILRTDAAYIQEKVIKEDIKSLLEKWDVITEKTQVVSQKVGPQLIYDDHDVVEQTLRDIANKNTKKIYTNDEEIYKQILAKELPLKTELLEKDIFEYFGLLGELEHIENRRIWLSSGGYIVIDKTEALTAIDVNSGKCISERNIEITALKVNLEAAAEIMKQLRLKDIGGIIVIDYIDMSDEEHKERVLQVMRSEAKKDRSKIDIRQFTELNLVEMTRKKMHL